MHIKAGGYNDASQGWSGGYATESKTGDAIYLACEFTVVEGEYAKRKIWSNIGLYSSKNDNRWGKMGKSFICGILDSARGFSRKDNSPEAQEARRINSFADLNYLEFLAKIDIEEDTSGKQRNVIKAAIDARHPEYSKYMGAGATFKPNWA